MSQMTGHLKNICKEIIIKYVNIKRDNCILKCFKYFLVARVFTQISLRLHSGIAWSFRFPSMGTLQNLGTSGRRRKRNGLESSDSCKDLRGKRHTIHLQPDIVIQREPCLIVTPPSPDDFPANSNPGYVSKGRSPLIARDESHIVARIARLERLYH